LLEAMGGGIVSQTPTDGGARLTFWLPRAMAADAADAVEEGEHAVP
jgi:hypothetical protein